MSPPRLIPLAAVVLALCVGCAAFTRTPSTGTGLKPTSNIGRQDTPSADAVLREALYTRTPEGEWVTPPVNTPPGAVHIGETTRADLLRLFGYPTQRRTTATGGELWYYAATTHTPDLSGPRPPPSDLRVGLQRKLVVTFTEGSDVVTDVRTYVTGERVRDPFRDTGPAFPELEPDVIPAAAPRAETARVGPPHEQPPRPPV